MCLSLNCSLLNLQNPYLQVPIRNSVFLEFDLLQLRGHGAGWPSPCVEVDLGRELAGLWDFHPILQEFTDSTCWKEILTCLFCIFLRCLNQWFREFQYVFRLLHPWSLFVWGMWAGSDGLVTADLQLRALQVRASASVQSPVTQNQRNATERFGRFWAI